jgi:hypothetical protein
MRRVANRTSRPHRIENQVSAAKIFARANVASVYRFAAYEMRVFNHKHVRPLPNALGLIVQGQSISTKGGSFWKTQAHENDNPIILHCSFISLRHYCADGYSG